MFVSCNVKTHWRTKSSLPQSQHCSSWIIEEVRNPRAEECLTVSCCFSLPGLRPLLDVNYLPLTDMRIARTFCFTNLGQALYLTSPTEIQRITYSQEVCENLQVSKSVLLDSSVAQYLWRCWRWWFNCVTGDARWAVYSGGDAWSS